MSKSNDTLSDGIIAVEDVQKAPRGRKPVFDDALCDLLAQVGEGQAVRLGGHFGQVEKERRATVGQIIRKNWAHVRNDRPSINWTPEGVAQVSIGKPRS